MNPSNPLTLVVRAEVGRLWDQRSHQARLKLSKLPSAMLPSAGYLENKPELLASILAPAQQQLGLRVCSDQAAIFEKER